MKATVTLNANADAERRNRWLEYFGSETIVTDVTEEWNGDIQTDWGISLDEMSSEILRKIATDICARPDNEDSYEEILASLEFSGVQVKCQYITVTPLPSEPDASNPQAVDRSQSDD